MVKTIIEPCMQPVETQKKSVSMEHVLPRTDRRMPTQERFSLRNRGQRATHLGAQSRPVGGGLVALLGSDLATRGATGHRLHEFIRDSSRIDGYVQTGFWEISTRSVVVSLCLIQNIQGWGRTPRRRQSILGERESKKARTRSIGNPSGRVFDENAFLSKVRHGRPLSNPNKGGSCVATRTKLHSRKE